MITYSAACPSCGAPLVFHSAATLSIVCDYCKSTLVREADELKNIGRMAELLTDHSLLQLGTEGRYRGLHFTVIGRIQLRYPSGVWSEWFIAFDDGHCAWLSDASGEMIVTFRLAAEKVAKLPSFGSLAPGQTIQLLGQKFAVGNQETAEVIAAAGELPQEVVSGYLAPVVDLRMLSVEGEVPSPKFVEGLQEAAGQQNTATRFIAKNAPLMAFATLDYSDTSPGVFIGEVLPPASLKLTGLKDELQQVRSVQAFKCPGCGASLSARSSEILAVACASCGTIVDPSNETLKVLSKAQKRLEKIKPAIPLGSRARFDGYDYELIGLIGQKMTSDGVIYRWREYLLHCPKLGFRWLTEYNGHWNFVTPLSGVPAVAKSSRRRSMGVKWEGRIYESFQTSTATVEYVLGEFYWQVKRGDANAVVVNDYIAPPYVLSSEKTGHELTWSQGVYIEPGVVRKAFDLSFFALPTRSGMGANQPSPYFENQKKMLGLCLGLILVSLVIQVVVGFIYNNDKALLEHRMYLMSDSQPSESLTAHGAAVGEKVSFESPSEPSNITFVANRASGVLSFASLRTPSFDFGGGSLYVQDQAVFPDNAWLEVNLSLVNQGTGEQIGTTRELYRASGYDSDGHWSEVKNKDELVFTGLAPGRYYFLVEPEYGSDALRNQRVSLDFPPSLLLKAQSARIGWGNWWLFSTYILVLLAAYFWRKESVEMLRWQESDHEYPVSWVRQLLRSDDDD